MFCSCIGPAGGLSVLISCGLFRRLSVNIEVRILCGVFKLDVRLFLIKVEGKCQAILY